MPRISLNDTSPLSSGFVEGTSIHTLFKLGDTVTVKPWNTEGRVMSMWYKPEGLLIEVRYYTDKERKFDYFYEDELEFVTEKKTGF